MINKEIEDAYKKMEEGYYKLERMIPERIKELYEISKQKGINDFGWKGGYPNEDDYDDPNEYDSVRDEFFGSELFITNYDEHSSSELAAYRFKFNDKGELVITEYYEFWEKEYVTECEIRLPYNVWKYISEMVGLINMIESELGIE